MGTIKVLHIIKSLGRGGAETLLPETIAVHDKGAFEFHVIYFLPWKDQLVETIRKAGGVVTCFSATNNLRILLQARKVIRYVREHEIDVIHCHLPWAGFLGRIVYQMTGVPVLYTEHNKQERYHILTKTINQLTFNWQTAGIAVSEEVARSIQKNIHPEISVETVLNGVNTGRFVVERNVVGCGLSVVGSERSGEGDPGLEKNTDVIDDQNVGEDVMGYGLRVMGLELSGENESIQKQNTSTEKRKEELGIRNWEAGRRLRKELAIKDDEILIGTIAVFRFQKRLDVWLEVFAELRKRHSNIRGIIVGDGPLKELVHQKHKELQLEGIVFLPGLQANPLDWLSAMDIYMMSSMFEGLPIALLEAMSCGLPVVCTNAGGTGEVIRDGVDGFLVPVEEPMQLVEPLASLVSDEGLRQRMGVAARRRVEEGFSLERMVGELEGMYRRFVLRDKL